VKASVASPKLFEAVWCHLGVPDRVLNVPVAEVVLQGPRVVTIVGELEPTGMVSKAHIVRQHEIIRELAQRGHETDLAETMLRILEANLRTFERHRDLILTVLKART